MKSSPLLSICIPVYRRYKNLLNLLKSINDKNSNVEIIIVNDGSRNNLKKKIIKKKFNLNLRVFENKFNRGRSSALADSIKLANGKFTTIMDSDDIFLPDGLEIITRVIKKKRYKNINSFLFGIKLKKSNKYITNLPPNNLISNLLKIRADYDLRGDMKEVVKTSIIKLCIYKDCYKFRRTPTSLIWECVSRNAKCLSISRPVILKNYLKTGLTSSISKIKLKNAEPMFDLYKQYYFSDLYNSRLFRIRSKIQFYKYLFITGNKLEIKFGDIIYIILGFFFCKFDQLKMS